MRIYDNLTLFNEMLGHDKAVFSVVSSKSGDRKTFQVERAPDRGKNANLTWFVSQLTGPDNRLSYTYLLVITARGNGDVPVMKLTAKSPASGWDHEAVKAFRWLFRNATRETETLSQAEVWLACNCSRCGKLLTVPESIARKMGPTCAGLE